MNSLPAADVWTAVLLFFYITCCVFYFCTGISDQSARLCYVANRLIDV